MRIDGGILGKSPREFCSTGLLLTLDALLKDQNVTHAAERLNITQSALSASVEARLRQLLNDLPVHSRRVGAWNDPDFASRDRASSQSWRGSFSSD